MRNKLMIWLLLFSAAVTGAAETVAPPGFLPISVKGDDKSYLILNSMKIHPDNGNPAVFRAVINADSGGEVKGTSLVQTYYVNCGEQLAILNPVPAEAYADFFARGPLLMKIPLKSERISLEKTSLLRIFSALACKKAGLDFNHDPDALLHMKEELEALSS